jgi:hypothetical protein
MEKLDIEKIITIQKLVRGININLKFMSFLMTFLISIFIIFHLI